MACPQKDGSDSVHRLFNHEMLNFEDQLEGPEFALQTQVQTNEVRTTNLNSANDDVFDFSNQQPQSFPNCSAPPPTETQQGHQNSFPEGLSLCDTNFSFLEDQSHYQFSEAIENFQPVQVMDIHNGNNMSNQTLMQDQIVTSTDQATSLTPNDVGGAMQKSLQAFWSLAARQNPTMNFQTTQNIRNATSSIYAQQPNMFGGAQSNSVESESHATSIHPILAYGNQDIQNCFQPSFVGVESNYVNSGSHAISMYPAQLYGNQNIQSLSQPSLVGAENNSINSGCHDTSMYPAQLYGNQNIQSLSQPSLVGAESNLINSGSHATSMYPAQLYGHQNIQSLFQPSLVGAESNSINSGSQDTSMYPAQLYGHQNIQSLSQPSLVGAESNSINSGSQDTSMYPAQLYGNQNNQSLSQTSLFGVGSNSINSGSHDTMHPSLLHGIHNIQNLSETTIHGGNIQCVSAPVQQQLSLSHNRTNQMSNNRGMNIPMYTFRQLGSTLHGPTMSNLQPQNSTREWPKMTNLQQYSPTMQAPTITNLHQQSPTMHGPTVINFQPHNPTLHGSTIMSHLQPRSATTHGPTTLSFSLLSSEEQNTKLLGHSTNGSPEVTSSRPPNAIKAKNVKKLRKLHSETMQSMTVTPTPSVLTTHQYNKSVVINQKVDNSTAKQGKKETEFEFKRRGPGRPPKRQGCDLFNLTKVQKTEKSSSRFEKDESSVTPQKEQMTSENVKKEGQNANEVDLQVDSRKENKNAIFHKNSEWPLDMQLKKFKDPSDK